MLLHALIIAAPVVINEVLYDPPGPDAGGEFVELVNPGPHSVELAGYRLEFANGADGPVWQVRWRGQATDRVGAGARFLVADRGWTGPPADAEAALGLQNGPDALRLVRPDGSTDTVGWGDLTDASLSEGAPAADVRDQALARRPDAADTDDNRRDFRPAAPTPGAANWHHFDPELRSVAWSPPSVDRPGRTVEARLTLANAGLRDLAGTRVSLRLGGATAASMLPALPPDSSLVLVVPVVPVSAGSLAASLALRGEAAGDTVTLAAGRYQVGLPDLRLSEVMAAPDGGGEWCEVHNAGPVPRDLGELALRDEDGAWRPLPAAILAAGECRLVAEDAAALGAWLADLAADGAPGLCEPAPPLELGSWPALNNTAPAGREYADRIYLGTADGQVLDHATLGLGSGKAPDGRSLERGPDQSWRPATAAVGATPGCLPPPPPPGGAELVLAPNPFSAREGTGTVRAAFAVPDDRSGWELQVFDLWGRAVRDLGGDDLGPGPRLAEWDGRDDAGQPLPAGGYVAILRWRGPQGGLATAARRLVVIREARP